MARALAAWLAAFFFTQTVEVPIYVIALRRGLLAWGVGPPARSAADARSLLALYLIGFGASALTHPIVWFVFPRLPIGSYVVMVACAEVFAVVVEGVYLRALGVVSLRRGLMLSLLANAASASLGLTCRAVFGAP